MIDTWVLASVCMFLLALFALLRTIPGPTRFDRLVAVNAAITIAVAGALCLTIALGDIGILDMAIGAGVLCFAGVYATAHATRGDAA